MPTASPRPPLFDPTLIAPRRDRAERWGFADGADFLHREIAALIRERLDEITRPFADAAIVGSGGGVHKAALAGRVPDHSIHQIELSPARAARAGATLVDTLDPLPFGERTLDLALSMLEMHWSNDPVGHLIQLRRALRPDGLMIAALFGGQTLAGLRAALAEAEAEVTGGLSPRVAPMAEIRDLGALLQRAGFAMPVADTERIEVGYDSAIDLMWDLRAMGETNMLTERRRVPMRPDILNRTNEIYAARFASPDGRVRATFEIVFLTGWAPAANQPRPRPPGSATHRLADALGASEQSAGEHAAPGTDRPGDKASD